jgi:lipopolysaccharide/colanic/teichoic acid biosynthesis glycosyltransferase
MSLVGPRPPVPYEAELYSAREWQRQSVPPGITGLWQVSGRSTLSFREMIELDLQYVESWSIWLDVKILLRTPRVILNLDEAG